MSFNSREGVSERKALAHLSLGVLALNAGAWTLLCVVIASTAMRGTDPAGLVGLGMSAYALGIRHAFDADHIAAVDNATRRLITLDRPTVSVGFWFALGHSTVVLGAVALMSAGFDAFSASLADEGSALRAGASLWGSAISAAFLLLVGAMNIPPLKGMGDLLRGARGRSVNATALERQLNSRGLLIQALGPLIHFVDAPWKMYPIGLLFGLGLDTAASVGLLASGALKPEMTPFADLAGPVLFTAGMTLFDSADGIAMSRLYRRASRDAYRKASYNFTITAISVAVAFFVGAIGLASVLAQVFDIASGPLAAVVDVDQGLLGIGFVVVFAAIGLWTSSRRRIGPGQQRPDPPAESSSCREVL